MRRISDETIKKDLKRHNETFLTLYGVEQLFDAVAVLSRDQLNIDREKLHGLLDNAIDLWNTEWPECPFETRRGGSCRGCRYSHDPSLYDGGCKLKIRG